MNTPAGSGIFLLLVVVALAMFVIFLISKRRSEGLLGNKFLIFGAAALLVIVTVIAKDPIAAYYQSLFKDPPYNFTELRSFIFKYGKADSMVNQYNSATGDYQYIDKRDSLIKTHLYLTKTDLLYLHRKAAELGFWEFPSNEVNTDTTNSNGVKPTTYAIGFNYLHKSKTVLFTVNYNGPQQLVEANRELIQEIQAMLSRAEERQQK